MQGLRLEPESIAWRFMVLKLDLHPSSGLRFSSKEYRSCLKEAMKTFVHRAAGHWTWLPICQGWGLGSFEFVVFESSCVGTSSCVKVYTHYATNMKLEK